MSRIDETQFAKHYEQLRRVASKLDEVRPIKDFGRNTATGQYQRGTIAPITDFGRNENTGQYQKAQFEGPNLPNQPQPENGLLTVLTEIKQILKEGFAKTTEAIKPINQVSIKTPEAPGNTKALVGGALAGGAVAGGGYAAAEYGSFTIPTALLTEFGNKLSVATSQLSTTTTSFVQTAFAANPLHTSFGLIANGALGLSLALKASEGGTNGFKQFVKDWDLLSARALFSLGGLVTGIATANPLLAASSGATLGTHLFGSYLARGKEEKEKREKVQKDAKALGALPVFITNWDGFQKDKSQEAPKAPITGFLKGEGLDNIGARIGVIAAAGIAASVANPLYALAAIPFLKNKKEEDKGAKVEVTNSALAEDPYKKKEAATFLPSIRGIAASPDIRPIWTPVVNDIKRVFTTKLSDLNPWAKGEKESLNVKVANWKESGLEELKSIRAILGGKTEEKKASGIKDYFANLTLPKALLAPIILSYKGIKAVETYRATLTPEGKKAEQEKVEAKNKEFSTTIPGLLTSISGVLQQIAAHAPAIPVPAPTPVQIPVPVVAPAPAPAIPVPATTQIPVPATTQIPVPATTQIPVPATTQIPVPATTQIPAPATTQIPVPATTQIPVPAPATTQIPVPVVAPGALRLFQSTADAAPVQIPVPTAPELGAIAATTAPGAVPIAATTAPAPAPVPIAAHAPAPTPAPVPIAAHAPAPTIPIVKRNTNISQGKEFLSILLELLSKNIISIDKLREYAEKGIALDDILINAIGEGFATVSDEGTISKNPSSSLTGEPATSSEQTAAIMDFVRTNKERQESLPQPVDSLAVLTQAIQDIHSLLSSWSGGSFVWAKIAGGGEPGRPGEHPTPPDWVTSLLGSQPPSTPETPALTPIVPGPKKGVGERKGFHTKPVIKQQAESQEPGLEQVKQALPDEHALSGESALAQVHQALPKTPTKEEGIEDTSFEVGIPQPLTAEQHPTPQTPLLQPKSGAFKPTAEHLERFAQAEKERKAANAEERSDFYSQTPEEQQHQKDLKKARKRKPPINPKTSALEQVKQSLPETLPGQPVPAEENPLDVLSQPPSGKPESGQPPKQQPSGQPPEKPEGSGRKGSVELPLLGGLAAFGVALAALIPNLGSIGSLLTPVSTGLAALGTALGITTPAIAALDAAAVALTAIVGPEILPVIIGLGVALAGLLAAVIALIAIFAGLVIGLKFGIDLVEATLKGLNEAAKDLSQGFLSALNAFGSGNFFGGIGQGATALVKSFQDVSGAVLSSVPILGGLLQNALGLFTGGLMTAIDGMTGFAQAMIPFVQAVSPATTQKFSLWMDGLKATIGTAFTGFISLMGDSIRDIGGILLPVMQELKPVFDELGQIVRSILLPAFKIFAAVLGSIIGPVRGALDGLKSVIGEVIKGLIIFAAGLAKLFGANDFFNRLRTSLAQPERAGATAAAQAGSVTTNNSIANSLAAAAYAASTSSGAETPETESDLLRGIIDGLDELSADQDVLIAQLLGMVDNLINNVDLAIDGAVKDITKWLTNDLFPILDAVWKQVLAWLEQKFGNPLAPGTPIGNMWRDAQTVFEHPGQVLDILVGDARRNFNNAVGLGG